MSHIIDLGKAREAWGAREVGAGGCTVARLACLCVFTYTASRVRFVNRTRSLRSAFENFEVRRNQGDMLSRIATLQNFPPRARRHNLIKLSWTWMKLYSISVLNVHSKYIAYHSH